MRKIWEWVKKHKALSILLIIIAYFGWSIAQSMFGESLTNLSLPQMTGDNQSSGGPAINPMPAGGLATVNNGSLQMATFPAKTYNATATAPQSTDQNRMVQQESSLSLLVSDVRAMADSVINQAKFLNGFMVSSSYSNPGEAPTATIVVRVPSAHLNTYLDYLRKTSLNVVSEDLTGEDITDQYKDTAARLATLNATKAKFAAILEKATAIQDILDVQNQIIQLQDQIDALKGQEQYMKQSTDLSKVTVYLSTDELSLPYAPDQSWRPAVVFKNAVRSLIGTLRGFASFVIWILVYAVIWLPILALIYIIRKYVLRKKIKSPQTT